MYAICKVFDFDMHYNRGRIRVCRRAFDVRGIIWLVDFIRKYICAIQCAILKIVKDFNTFGGVLMIRSPFKWAGELRLRHELVSLLPLR